MPTRNRSTALVAASLLLALFASVEVTSATGAASAGDDWMQTCGLTVGGVRLDTTYVEVIRRLGKPRRQSTRRDDSMGVDEIIRTLTYPGLRVDLYWSAERRSFEVNGLEITSRQWRVEPGVRVGMTHREVIGALGTPSADDDDGGVHEVWYRCSSVDAFAVLAFKQGKVASIRWEFDLS